MEQRRWHGRGEVTDREDLLDGRVRIELEGLIEGGDGDGSVEAGLGWRRGRGTVSLEAADSYLTLITPEGEWHAAALEGTVIVDSDTAASRIEARFLVEDGSAASGDAGTVHASLVVGPEEWSGEIALGDRRAP